MPNTLQLIAKMQMILDSPMLQRPELKRVKEIINDSIAELESIGRRIEILETQIDRLEFVVSQSDTRVQ